MISLVTSLKDPLIIGTILVLPFAILEIINRRTFNEPFPFLLFFILWLLPIAFMVNSSLILKKVRSGNQSKGLFVGTIFLTVTTLLFAVSWLSLIQDQMPCFLGVANCD